MLKRAWFYDIVFLKGLKMEKNYYDILQVNKNASPEIIEKAYKVLAKKYHPDLQEEENKKQSEEFLKEINEAYEVLSNSEKKNNYDNLLKEKEKLENKQKFQQQNNSNNSGNHQNTYTSNISKDELLRRQEIIQKQQQYNKQVAEQLKHEQELAYQEQLQYARQKAYHDAYIQDLKNRGYKIRYKKSFKDYINGFIALAITILILFFIYQIPFVKSYFWNLYNENELVHFIRNILN